LIDQEQAEARKLNQATQHVDQLYAELCMHACITNQAVGNLWHEALTFDQLNSQIPIGL